MFITQETQGASGPVMEPGRVQALVQMQAGSPVQSGTQEAGTSMEESGGSPGENGFQNVCSAEEDMGGWNQSSR